MDKREVLKRIYENGRSKEYIEQLKKEYYDSLSGTSKLTDKEVIHLTKKLLAMEDEPLTDEAKRIKSLTMEELTKEVFGGKYIDFDALIIN